MTLSERMKRYEAAFKPSLPRRLPVVVRVDGRAFHTFTRGFQKPFDDGLRGAMSMTAARLCEEMSGAKIAYTQSDEISVVLTNDDTLDTEPWFNNDLSKLVSLSASIATGAFNAWYDGKFATFDARAFVLPDRDEVVNYLIWRQRDAERNSLSMLAQSLYSQKELNGKGRAEQHDMIHAKSANWNDVATMHKRGVAVVRKDKGWEPDFETPVFSANRNYVLDALKPKLLKEA